MGLKIFSRRSSTTTVVKDDEYLRLQQENRRLRQITARIAAKIGIHKPKTIKAIGNNSSEKQLDDDDDEFCPPPHVIMAQAHRLQKLNELVVALSQAPRVADAYKIVAQYTREIVGAARVSIALLVDDDKDVLEIYGLDGSEGALPLGMRVPIEGTQVGQVVTGRRPIRVMDCSTAEYGDCQKLSQMGVEACVDVPMISSGKVLGTLNTGVTDRAVYYPEVESMLLQISSVLASAIHKERLLEEAISARNSHQSEQQAECAQCRNKRLMQMNQKAPRSTTN